MQKKRLTNYEKTIKISEDASYIISGKEIIHDVDTLVDYIKKTTEEFQRLLNSMEEQNIFNKKEIFTSQEISMVSELCTNYDNDVAESELLCYMMYDEFFVSLGKIIKYFDIKIEEIHLDELIEPILESLKEIPQIHKKFYDKHSKIREEVSEYIDTRFI